MLQCHCDARSNLNTETATLRFTSLAVTIIQTMSKKQKIRKLTRLEQIEMEKMAIIARKKERLAPIYTEVKRFSVALFSTVLLLVIGVIVNNHLHQIAQFLKTAK